ncbi:CYTH domain-containing protein [Kurthia massiliensis]|uniref:CYTH domain-containing protein n=1 Tax=Kurthia massiliensis TaxID=1033739 RepID=UPI000288DEF9|nr:CYTH domain-containing protein [Kurthia massiliensis]
MSKQLEIEFKNMLSKEHFDALTKAFQLTDDDFHTQANHYFDTADFALKQQKCGLRIREVANRFECTLKEPASGIGLLETTDLLDEQHVRDVLENSATLHAPEVHARLEARGIAEENLQLLGTLSTTRAEINYKGGLLVLDHSVYADIEDYELEYEVPDEQAFESIFLALLTQFHIPLQPAQKKVARFVAAMNRKRGI